MTHVTKQTVLVAIAACVVVAMIVTAFRITMHAQRDTERAIAKMENSQAQMHDVQVAALAGATAAAAYKVTMDSLAAHPRIDTVYVKRQYTPVVIDTGDVQSVASGIVSIAAERDTAIVDRNFARDTIKIRDITIEAMRAAATVHADSDIVRFAAITAHTDVAVAETHDAIALVQPGFWRRAAHIVVQTVKIGTVAAIAFTAGRKS